MVPSTLQGLNEIRVFNPQDSPEADSLLSASSATFPELEFWTNLTFENSDLDDAQQHNHRHFRPSHDNAGKILDNVDNDVLEEDDDGSAPFDHGHPVVHPPNNTTDNANNSSNNNIIGSARATATETPTVIPQSLDLQNFLAGFGIDPLLVPQPFPAPQQPQLTTQQQQASLAHLLMLHEAALATPMPRQQPPQQQLGQAPPPYMSPVSYENPTSSPDLSGYPPPAKRSRTTRNLSVPPPSPLADEHQLESPHAMVPPGIQTPLSAAEDKRRRNTAASARFRLKKKEREAALETRAKELELRVGELERECEGLRRENGWLKGLVVGVTGAGVSGVKTKRLREEETAAQDS